MPSSPQAISHKRAATVDLYLRKRHVRNTRSLDSKATRIVPAILKACSVSDLPSEIRANHPSTDMDTSRSYRVGSPALISAPFDTKLVYEIPQWDVAELHEAARKTLEDANVYVCGQCIVRRFRPGNGTNTPPATLSIESDLSRDGQYECWKAGFNNLRCLLDATGLEEMLIEIVDRRAAREFSAGPVLESTPKMFEHWQSFVSVLLDEIGERDWLSVDTVTREFGTKRPFTVTTVLVTTTDADDEIWGQAIIPRLRRSLPPDMDIDVIYARALSQASSDSSQEDTATQAPSRPAIHTTMADYSSVVQMGSSIGLHEPANSATVGAVVKLRDNNGNETLCGLTNHHVVAQKHGLISQNCPEGKFLSPHHPICRDGQVRVVAPSHPDDECLFNLTTTHRNDFICQVIEMTQAHRQESSLYACATRRLAETLADWEALAKNPDRHFGTVWATSGYRICNNASYTKDEKHNFSSVAKAEVGEDSTCLQTIINGRSLDFGLNWALIKMAVGRDLDEYVPATPEYLKLRAGAHVAQFTQIKADKSYNVAKRGRTTGWTHGTISQIGSILRLRPRPDGVNVVPVDLRKRFGEANIILAFGVFHREKGRDFMKGGDSGSCVLLDEACRTATMVGLLFASNELVRVSYMMPLDMVVQDIEQVTGQTVIQPKLVKYADRLRSAAPCG